VNDEDLTHVDRDAPSEQPRTAASHEAAPPMKMWSVPKDVERHRKIRYYQHAAVRHGIKAREHATFGFPLPAYFEAREAAHYAGMVIGYKELAGLTLCQFAMEVRTVAGAIDPVDELAKPDSTTREKPSSAIPSSADREAPQ
jgi:hypothetical protein